MVSILRAITRLVVGCYFASSTGSIGVAAEPLITPGESTTRATGPLDDEGYVDFLRVINNQGAEGVTPENNAAVLLFEAYGKIPDTDGVGPLVRAELGLPELPADAQSLVTWKDWLAKEHGNLPPPSEPGQEDEFKQARQRTWKASEFPMVSRLLEHNARALELGTEASRRTRFYCPLVKEYPNQLLMAVPLHNIQLHREINRQFMVRSLLHLGEGRVAASREDLMTSHRLAILISHSHSLIETLGAMIDNKHAYSAGLLWAEHPAVTPFELRAFRQELNQLSATRSLVDSFDRGERWFGSDGLQGVLRGRHPEFLAKEFANETESPASVNKNTKSINNLLAGVALRFIDWNAAMAAYQTQCDEVSEAFRIQEPQARLKELDRLLDKLRSEHPNSRGQIAKLLSGFQSAEGHGNQFGKDYTIITIPEFRMSGIIELRNKLLNGMHIVNLSLHEYRLVHGQFPDNLAALVPDVLEVLPLDSFNDAPLRYVRTLEGFRLWSVGPDGHDQDGVRPQYPEDDDDFVFEFPRPAETPPGR